METALEELEVRVDRPAPEGQGIARSVPGAAPAAEGAGGSAAGPRSAPTARPEGSTTAGRVIFVPYAAPGDRLRVRLRKVEKGFAEAELLEVLSPGPERVEPVCAHHFRPGGPLPCGGCNWQQLSAKGQLEAKRDIVVDCLRRIGRIPEPPVEPALPSPKVLRYRNKVLIPFGAREGRVVAGFFSPGTNAIVDFTDCPVQPELSVRIALRVKALCAELGWRPYDVRAHEGWLRHLLVRTNEDGKALIALVTNDSTFPRKDEFLKRILVGFPEIVAILHNVQPHRTSVALGSAWRTLWGESELEERLGTLRLRAAPAAFMQVNTPASLVLYEAARALLCADGFRPELLFDLYSGVGSIALCLSGAAERIVGIEENRDAVENARRNARFNEVKNCEFVPGRVETALGRLHASFEKKPPLSCAALLDPPRAGCEESVLKSLNSPAMRRIVYISCNPATFARDAARLARGGWRLRRVQPVDLFPQTSHIETVGVFERDAPASPTI
ncbi:MAG: 23S rRNA (uracil(1939)-C(5))-methyltransferase RlmD [Elusimicrobiota bacterium]|jgi:23S rRNA (uracil1939-C5)-methyltransferase